MYSAVTRNITVSVVPFYLEERSDPDENRYVWGYRITIDNQSDDPVQLLSRYWHITDGAGRVGDAGFHTPLAKRVRWTLSLPYHGLSCALIW